MTGDRRLGPHETAARPRRWVYPLVFAALALAAVIPADALGILPGYAKWGEGMFGRGAWMLSCFLFMQNARRREVSHG